MNFAALKELATSKAARQILLTKKHSPKILFIAGTVGVVGTVVLACRATLKVSDVLDHHEVDEKLIRGGYPEMQAASPTVDKDVRRLQVKTGLEIAKLYAPAVGLGLVSIGALTGSHVILSQRNTAVMAAYAGLDQAYKRYRGMVKDAYGDDIDRKFAFGATTETVNEKLADGTTKSTEKTTVDKTKLNPYQVCYDEHAGKWTREPGMNPIVLGMIQSHANDKLRAQGHMFLNEVFDLLGLPHTKAGAVAGWVYRDDTEEKTGDNYVSFGVFENDIERGTAFVNGDEPSIWLDFNVDGIILDLI